MTVISMIPNDTPILPQKVTDVPREVLRNFPHSKKVGNYLLGNTLGEGSFAKVKEALHIPTGERVAVKIIDKKKSREDSYVRKNLRREGKILQMIRHANVVQLLEIMETQNSYYLVTELCRGGDLMDYISQKRKLPEAEVKKYIRQIVSAVDYLHRLGILHRDLKIENLLLDEYRDMKIIDFGLSNCVKVVHTKEGTKVQEYCVTQCGSPAYAAPELLGRRKYGPQVDIWSIGVNMYAMLTGNLPFTVEPFNIKALHNKMITSQMNPLPDNVSRECRDLIKKLLNPDPDRRISVEDILKHPWIGEGHGCPLPRAPCPNKMKADSIDNSILRHMSEVQGFRIGEIIRYVTGNVPSSATAMYYLISRKMRKHYGNLRASGKIAADNRTQKSQLTMETMRPRPGISTPQPTNAGTRVQVNHTANSIRNAVIAQQKSRAKDLVENHDSGDENCDRETEDEKSEDADAPFSDILQTKGTNGVIQIPRAISPQKPHFTNEPDHPSGTHLPRVANKYVCDSQKTPSTKISTNNDVKSTEPESGTNDVIDDVDSAEKRSATEAMSPREEPFRERASTFPGKTQRPSVTIHKPGKDKSGKETCEHTEVSPSVRIYKSKTDHEDRRMIRRDSLKPASPVSRQGSPYHVARETMVSPTGRTGSNAQHVIHFRKHSGIQRRIANSQKAREAEVSRDSLHDDEISAITKHVLSRPARTNRFSRAPVSTAKANNATIIEHLSEITSPTPRPVSSLNISGQTNNFRSATPALPSLGK